MSALYFKSSPGIYAQIQPAIDEAFRAEWIETGKCEHILPTSEAMPVRGDGMCYLGVPGWMIEVAGADIFRNWPGVTEITEEEYLAMIAPEEES